MMGNNDNLYNIPATWKWTTIGEISSVKGGKRLPKGSSYADENTGLYYLRVKDFENLSINTDDLRYIDPGTQEKISRYTISKEDVFISIVGSIGKVGVIPDFLDGVNLTENAAKITDIKDYNNKLLAYFLSSQFAQAQISELVTSSNQPKLALFRIEKIALPLIPLSEKEHIVARIEETFTQLDAGVAELGNAKAQLRRYRAAVLKSAVEGELTREWRELHQGQIEPAETLLAGILSARREKWEAEGGKGKYKELALPNADNLPVLPDGWTWGSLEQISTHIVDCLHSTPKFTKSGKYCIDTTCIESGRILFDRARFVSEETYQDRIRRLVPKAGDILFAREGTIGTTVVVPENVELCLGQRMMMFRPTSAIYPMCFMYAMLSPIFENQWKPKVMGTTAPHVNIGDLRTMALPIPPIQEQKILVDKVERRLSVADEIEKELDGGLPCGDDMVRAERLRACPDSRRRSPPVPERVQGGSDVGWRYSRTRSGAGC
jgi:type I restriction enzyme S subunit